jgi:3-oxoacyl-[acyl-carrier protein] reductase
MSDQPGKVALITGASRGIGAATAIEFARRGYDVGLTSDDAAGLEVVAREIASLGIRSERVIGDLSDIRFVESLVPSVVQSLGRVDVLVNNAAWRELVTMRQISLESWEKTLRVCLTAPAFLARAAAKDMEARKSGVIINISSIMSQMASGIAPAYIAAKGALDALTYDLAALFGPVGIRVVAVNPGAVDTELGRDYKSKESDQSNFEHRLRDWSEQMIPSRRWAQPREIACIIAMLASDDASYINGTTVFADGGWSHQFEPYGFKREQHPDQFR